MWVFFFFSSRRRHTRLVRDWSSDVCSSDLIQKYMTDLALDEDLYNAVVAYSKSKEAQQLTGYKKKFIDDTLLDYKRSGFRLPKVKRDKVKNIFNELADLGLAFNKNISEYQDTLFVSAIEIEGLPENYQKERLQTNGSYAIDMSYQIGRAHV